MGRSCEGPWVVLRALDEGDLMKRRVAVGVAVAALAGVVVAGGPAGAETSGAGAGASRCGTGPTVLETLPAGSWSPGIEGGVHGLGRPGVAVGSSGGLPVYWTGKRVHRVPLPEGYTHGVLTAVNKRGTAVGWASRDFGRARALFTYRLGAPAVEVLSEGARGAFDAAVNDAGYVAAVDTDGVPRVWRKGEVVRSLPLPADAHPDTRVSRIAGINADGDIVASADWEGETDEDGYVHSSFPIVWPGDGGPARAVPVKVAEPFTYNVPDGIDNEGRVVGSYSFSYRGWEEGEPWVWQAPYEDHGVSAGRLKGRAIASFAAISPNTNVSVGSALTIEEGAIVKNPQALLWPGQGPVLALPGLAPEQDAEAWAVSDDDRVGGVASPESGGAKPVIWHCASKQAYLP